MDFNKALTKAQEQLPVESRISDTDKISVIVTKTMCLTWSMLAIALKESEGENILDDLAYYCNNMNELGSIPLEVAKEDKKEVKDDPKPDETVVDEKNNDDSEKTTTKKSAKKKSSNKKDDVDNGKEKESQEESSSEPTESA